jgi:PLP dependent protein
VHSVPSEQSNRIRARAARVESRIQAACVLAGRDRHEVTLVAVTKGRSLDEVVAAYGAGLHHLGENRVEELEARQALVAERLPGAQPVWHMIGHVQSRKAERVVATNSLVHSVDSLRLGQRLERAAALTGRKVSVLLQVNVSGEASKSGLACAMPGHESGFLEEVRALAALDHLEIRGLMTIAPLAGDPEASRPVFQRLRALRDRLCDEIPASAWHELSMGMTADYEIAVQEGATMVRIGRALFDPPQPTLGAAA